MTTPINGPKTQSQLALQLFEDLDAKNLDVTQLPETVGFQRNDAFIEIVDLTLGGRRLIDVAYFFVSDENESTNLYRCEQSLFKWLMGTTSNNRDFYERCIREAQKGAIQVREFDHDDPKKDRWGAIPLLGPAFLANGEFVFEIPARLKKIIRAPASSHFFSLRYVFSSIHSRALWDRLQPYLAQGVSPFFELETIRKWLSCTDKYPAYKAFKAKVLDAALTDITAVTGLTIKLMTRNEKGSKKIEAMRFLIEGKLNNADTTTAEMAVLRDTYQILRKEFGLTQNQIATIVANRDQYTDTRIKDAIDYTKFKIQQNAIKKSVSGYFMKALESEFVMGEAEKQIYQQKLELSTSKVTADITYGAMQTASNRQLDEEKDKKFSRGEQLFNTLSEDEIKEKLAVFSTKPQGRLFVKLHKLTPSERYSAVNTNPALKTSFFCFLAEK